MPPRRDWHVFKSLVPQPCGDVKGALTVMTENGDVLLGIKFLMSAGWDIAHRHRRAGFDVGRGVFPRLADVNEAGLVFAKKSSGARSERFRIRA